jgi:hypothetical protein
MSQSYPRQLEYVQIGQRRLRRTLLRALVLVTAAATALVVLPLAPSVMRHSSEIYWQRRCRAFAPPSTQVVYEEDPVAGDRLLNSRHAGYGAQHVAARRTPVVTFAPDCWNHFSEIVGNLPNKGEAVLFLGERISSCGNYRLVAVLCPAAAAPARGRPLYRDFHSVVIAPAGPLTKARRLVSPRHSLSGGPVGAPSDYPPHITFYAGQRDSMDRAAFSIPFTMHGQTGIIRGRLLDDDTIEFKS